MDLSLFLDPFDITQIDDNALNFTHQILKNNVTFFQESDAIDLSSVQIAILGIPESRNGHRNDGTAFAPDEIRKEFYQLYGWEKEVNMIDLGNVKIGESIEDTYHIVSEIIAHLNDKQIVTIVLGGSNDLVYPIYKGYEKLEKVVNMVAVDATFDIGSEETPIRSTAYLDKILMQQPNYLLNYANLGYQTYLNSQEAIEMMDKLYFETYRVGEIRDNLINSEAVVRNADILSLDISAIRRADAPGNPFASANGFYGEEICQIAKYAGISDKLSTFGVFEYNPSYDYHQQTAQAIAQMIWYFVEGFSRRINDIQFEIKENYTRYSVTTLSTIEDMIFYKSKKTGRWWMILPIYQKNNDKELRYFLPCTEDDYHSACQNIVPDRWWKNFEKLNR